MPLNLEIRLLRFVRRNLLATMTVLYLLPLFWCGLVPFDFGGTSDTAGVQATRWGLPLADVHIPDFVANVGLYLPLAMLLRATLLRRRWNRWTSLVAGIVVPAGLSYLTEVSQLYSPSRISSFADLIANGMGATLGALSGAFALMTARVIEDLGVSRVRRWREDWRARPTVICAQIVAAALLLASIAPFDLTFSPNRVLASVKDARLTPFTQTARISTSVAPELSPLRETRQTHVWRDQWQIRFDYLVTIAGYALLAILLYRYLSTHCRVRDSRRGIWIVFVCAMLALLSSAARIFINTRTADVTDVMLAVLGSACGVLVAKPFWMRWMARSTDDDAASVRARRRNLIGLGLAAWGLMLVARQFAPFTVDASIESIGRHVAGIEWLPFQTYQQARLPVAIDDFLAKLGRYAILGLLACAYIHLNADPDKRTPRVIATALVAGLVMAALEMLQTLIPSRVPAITDVVLAAAGTGSAVLAYRLGAAFWLTEIQPASRAQRLILNVEFDTHAPAPQEHVPTPRMVTGRDQPPRT